MIKAHIETIIFNVPVSLLFTDIDKAISYQSILVENDVVASLIIH